MAQEYDNMRLQVAADIVQEVIRANLLHFPKGSASIEDLSNSIVEMYQIIWDGVGKPPTEKGRVGPGGPDGPAGPSSRG